MTTTTTPEGAAARAYADHLQSCISGCYGRDGDAPFALCDHGAWLMRARQVEDALRLLGRAAGGLRV